MFGNNLDVEELEPVFNEAIANGTRPIIGVTKVEQVQDAAKAVQVEFFADEMEEIETTAAQTCVDTRGSWENQMA